MYKYRVVCFFRAISNAHFVQQIIEFDGTFFMIKTENHQTRFTTLVVYLFIREWLVDWLGPCVTFFSTPYDHFYRLEKRRNNFKKCTQRKVVIHYQWPLGHKCTFLPPAAEFWIQMMASNCPNAKLPGKLMVMIIE